MCLWFEEALKKFNHILVVISHSQDVLSWYLHYSDGVPVTDEMELMRQLRLLQ
jgi:hypothetical protein